MTTFVVKRLLGLLPIMIGISVVVFLIMRMLPGDVASMILMGADEEGNASVDAVAIEALRTRLGLNEPLHLQYLSWIGGLLQFDAGSSLWSGRAVLAEIGERLPLTLELALLSLVISIVIAIPGGVLSALYQNSWIDYFFRAFSIGGLALPTFWLGTLTILFLTVWFNWVPPLGYASFTDNPWLNIQQLFWPALVIGYSNAAVITRMTRSTMLEVMREDFVRTAWSKGLSLSHIVSAHAVRNAMLPVMTLIAIELGHLIGGTVVMETIFTLPGIGRYLVDAILRRDYPVVQNIVLFMGAMFVLLNLAVDLLYGVLDPRIRQR